MWKWIQSQFGNPDSHDKTPYTPGLREVIKRSKGEAGRLGHDYIGPEHYLLGIIRKGDGLAVQVLINLGIRLAAVKAALEDMLEIGHGGDINNLFAPNSEAKRVLEAMKEHSRSLGHNWVGTEHLLLGLITVENTVAAMCLTRLGITVESARAEVLAVIRGSTSVKAQPGEPEPEYMKRWSPALKDAVQRGKRIAEEANVPVRVEHYLLGVLQRGTGAGLVALRQLGVDLKQLTNLLDSTIASASPDEQESVASFDLSLVRNPNPVRWHLAVHTEDLILEILSRDDSAAARILSDAGVTTQNFQDTVRQVWVDCQSATGEFSREKGNKEVSSPENA